MSISGENPLSSDRLAFLYQVSKSFNASLDLDDVLSTVIDEVIKLTGAERGFLMLFDNEGELKFQVARGIDKTTIENPEFEISRSVVNQVAQSGEAMFTSDAQKEEALSKAKSVIDFKLRAILCTPLKIKDKVLGVVYVDNRIISGVFADDDLEMLNAVSSTAAGAIENARLYKVAVEKGRMERELQVASKVQSSLIPQIFPEVSGWEFAGHWSPAREVAGDFYDFIQKENEVIGLLIADVVDKGMAAALFMAFSRSTLRASLNHAKSPKEGISDANRLICKDSAYGMFLTLAYAEIKPNSDELLFVNAGHNPPLHYQISTNEISLLPRTGMLMGIEEEVEYQQSNLALKTGDFILFYTDGVTEAINENEEEFGEERLLKVVLDNKGGAAELVIKKLLEAIELFIGEAKQFDDITLLIAKRI